jgi:hypothetical protein
VFSWWKFRVSGSSDALVLCLAVTGPCRVPKLKFGQHEAITPWFTQNQYINSERKEYDAISEIHNFETKKNGFLVYYLHMLPQLDVQGINTRDGVGASAERIAAVWWC